MTDFDSEEPLTSTVRPLSDSVLTIRLIKSFPYRNVRNHVYQHIDLANTSPKSLFEMIKKTVATDGGLRPFRNVDFDTIKIYTHAHGTKTINLIINMDHDDDWVLDLSNEEKKLIDYDIENETELSVYNLKEYESYKDHPEDKWI